ncbi:methyltransferase-like protein 25 [Bradysia coprophila]|uniref:methyltransferase-like protein 25 n=1 Tax=Bradysia coprophila TaxID=38358 RepID=UPI00187D8ABE|nr:methyltransferase-like protein 25 [Bradysia coprophila]
MGDVTIPLLKRHLHQAITYLNPFLPYLNAHMTKFFSDNLWQRNVPLNIQSEIRTDADVYEAIKIYRHHLNPSVDSTADSDCFKNFRAFLRNTKPFYLDSYTDVWISPSELNRELKMAIGDEVHMSEGFMPQKKRHEVEAVANVIATICSMSKENGKLCVIDAGDGKGYLSSHLSLAYGIKVLGIDSECSRTSGASIRYTKLVEQLRKIRRKNQSTNEAQLGLSSIETNYRNVTHYITPQTDFLDLLSKEFNVPKKDIRGLCLTGLHTCGDLASTCLKIFCESNQISAICNIGCCYHLTTQRFNDTHQFNYSPALDHHRPLLGYGFPLSRYLIEKQIGFDVTSRQVSTISVHRSVNLTDNDVRYRCLFQRALLEILIQRMCPQYYGTTVTGRIRLANFTDYIRKVNCRNEHLNFDEEHISDEKLDELYDEFRKQIPFLILYHQMRDSLGSVIETIFVLDRLLYLKEQQQRNDVSFLVKFFDSTISPRCYGLVAIKNFL